MCMKLLKLHQYIPRIALTNIKVYKVMKLDHNNPNICYSAHRKCPYDLGELVTSHIERNSSIIGTGLHSFTHVYDAADEYHKYETDHKSYAYHQQIYKYNMGTLEGTKPTLESIPSGYGIYEAIIPRGSIYYTGVWEYEWPYKKIPNRVSNKLIITSRIL